MQNVARLKQSRNRMASVQSEFKVKATADASQAEQELTKFRMNFSALREVMAVSVAALGAFGAAMVSFAEDAAEQERQVARLRFAIEQLGFSYADNEAALNQYMTSTSRATGQADETLREVLTLIGSLTREIQPSIEQVMGLSTLALDIATQQGRSVQEVARSVSRVASGNLEAINELLPSAREQVAIFSQMESAALRGASGIQLLMDAYSGAASSGDDFARNMQVLRNELGDLRQTIGNVVLGSGDASRALESLLETIREYDARLADRDDPLAQNLTEIINATATIASVFNYAVDVTSNLYTTMVSLQEAVITTFVRPFSMAAEQLQAMGNAVAAGMRGDFEAMRGYLDESERSFKQGLDDIADAWGGSTTRIDEHGNAVYGTRAAYGGFFAEFANLSVAVFNVDEQLAAMAATADQETLPAMVNMFMQSIMQAAGLTGALDLLLETLGSESTQKKALPRGGGNARGGADPEAARRLEIEQELNQKLKDMAMAADAERLAQLEAAQATADAIRDKGFMAQVLQIEALKQLELDRIQAVQDKEQNAKLAQLNAMADQQRVAQQFSDTMMNSVQSGFTSLIGATQGAFEGLLSGADNVGATFGTSALKGLGAVASQVGTFLILAGTGFALLPGFISAGAAVGYGVALVGLGGVLGAASSAISGPSGGSQRSLGDNASGASGTGFGGGQQVLARPDAIEQNDYRGAIFVGQSVSSVSDLSRRLDYASAVGMGSGDV